MGSSQRNQVKCTGSWTPRVLYLGQGRQHLLSSFVELAAVVSVWGLNKLSSLSSKEAFSLRTLFSCVHQTHASAGHRSLPPAILTEFQLPPRTFFLLLLRIPSLWWLPTLPYDPLLSAAEQRPGTARDSTFGPSI